MIHLLRLALSLTLVPGCASVDTLVKKHEVEVNARLGLIAKACEALKTNRNEPMAQVAASHEPLIGLAPGYRDSGREAPNTLVAAASACPDMGWRDNKTLCLQQSCFSLGYAFPVGKLSDVFVHHKTPRAYELSTSVLKADIQALLSLDYLMLYTVDAFRAPALESEAQRFTPGHFKGRFFLYRLRGSQLLATTTIDISNTATIDVGLTGPQEVDFQDENGLHVETIDLGGWHDNAPRALIGQLEKHAAAKMASTFHYRDANVP